VQALTDYGVRPWQIDLTAGPIAQALGQARNALRDADDPDAGDTDAADAGAADA